jgi:PAS domain S-box-containing protein
VAALQTDEQRAEFDARLAQEGAAREGVERELAATRAAADQARQAFLDESAALTARMREIEANLTERLAREHADYETRLADQQQRLRTLSADRDALHQAQATSQEQLQHLSRIHQEATENFERVRQAKETELQRLGGDYTALRQTLEQVRADALKTLEHVTSEHAAELRRVDTLIAERDQQLKDQAERHISWQQGVQQSHAKLESELRGVVAARSQEIEKLRGELKTLTREFEAVKGHRDMLKIEADRLPQTLSQLEASRAESRRQFEQSPLGILRCSRAGALQEANRALLTTLGYRTVEELRARDLAASVFESADDLRWLIEQCQNTPGKWVDSIWKKKDGSRLVVRLHAGPVSADAIEIAAEDLTALRTVEDRLRQAQRMEAVGRLASEVAVTCDNLLRNVSQDGQQWLASVGSNTAQRHQGELIFGEVTRAASFLRQLSVYGAKQTSALEPVDVNKVLRDLEPVLKRVAGDDIELVLPQKVSALNVDVEAERVERVLVNVAAYGRARMPSGGRLIVKLARVTVDGSFVTKYPNVRQGPHALITVTEVRTTPRADWQIEGTADNATSERPGVDLGTLQALIRDCGGHLWMKAEPGGDMEVKIHLPLRPTDTSRSPGVARSGRGRSVGRWFQS